MAIIKCGGRWYSFTIAWPMFLLVAGILFSLLASLR